MIGTRVAVAAAVFERLAVRMRRQALAREINDLRKCRRAPSARADS
jgi:hypothetical protein